MAKTHQAIQVNCHRSPEPKYKVGDLVYLNTIYLHLRIKQQGHLVQSFPQFIGPFSILKVILEMSNYKFDLPAIYHIYSVFHVKLLKPSIPNDSMRFPAREPPRLGSVFKNDDRKADNYEVEYIQDHKDMVQR